MAECVCGTSSGFFLQPGCDLPLLDPQDGELCAGLKGWLQNPAHRGCPHAEHSSLLGSRPDTHMAGGPSLRKCQRPEGTSPASSTFTHTGLHPRRTVRKLLTRPLPGHMAVQAPDEAEATALDPGTGLQCRGTTWIRSGDSFLSLSGDFLSSKKPSNKRDFSIKVIFNKRTNAILQSSLLQFYISPFSGPFSFFLLKMSLTSPCFLKG